MIFAVLFELVLTHILHRKKLDEVGEEYLTKITSKVQKCLSRSHSGPIFCPSLPFIAISSKNSPMELAGFTIQTRDGTSINSKKGHCKHGDETNKQINMVKRVSAINQSLHVV